jgi:hypothetical protein
LVRSGSSQHGGLLAAILPAGSDIQVIRQGGPEFHGTQWYPPEAQRLYPLAVQSLSEKQPQAKVPGVGSTHPGWVVRAQSTQPAPQRAGTEQGEQVLPLQ